jgi:ATP-dependent DNA helicase RecQ
LSVYGIGRDRSLEEWRALARTLVHQRLVEQSQDGFSVLTLNDSSWQVLRSERAVSMAVAARPRRASVPAPDTDASRVPASSANASGANVGSAETADDAALFERLRGLRKRLADAQGLPPYIIFHDSTLREMAARRPQTLSEFATIRGVGEGKIARYGEQFIAALQDPVS